MSAPLPATETMKESDVQYAYDHARRWGLYTYRENAEMADTYARWYVESFCTDHAFHELPSHPNVRGLFESQHVSA